MKPYCVVVVAFLSLAGIRAEGTGSVPRGDTVGRSKPQLPPQSSTTEISRARVFSEPLQPTRLPTEAENQALLQGLSKFAARSERDDFSGLTKFLTEHPDSVWAVALLMNLGMEYYNTGYYSRAITAWQRAWQLGKNEADEGPKALAERAGAELAFLFARLGRMNELRELLRELNSHALRGTTAERVNGARHGLWSMETEPDKSFRCGPFALERIRSAFKMENPIHEAILNSKSTTNGFSLTQVEQLARAIGMNYQMAHRSPGAEFILPAVVHWKSGHYAALIRQRGGLHLAQAEVQQLFFDAFNGGIDLLRADRAFAQRQFHGANQLGTFKLYAPSILLDDGREVDVRALVGGKALLARAALAAPAYEVPVLGHPGFNDLGVLVAAKRALHRVRSAGPPQASTCPLGGQR